MQMIHIHKQFQWPKKFSFVLLTQNISHNFRKKQELLPIYLEFSSAPEDLRHVLKITIFFFFFFFLVEQNQTKFPLILKWLTYLVGNSWMPSHVFMLSVKVSDRWEWLCQLGLLALKGPNTGQVHPELLIILAKEKSTTPNFRIQSCDTPLRGSLMRSQLLMAASRVWKTWERLLLGMDILPLSPVLATVPDTSGEPKMSF